jgi:tRNA (cmo5U34)-methyltransferase
MVEVKQAGRGRSADPDTDPAAGGATLQALAVGENLVASNAGWTFAGEVSKVFDSHVSRSVPLYHEGHRLIAQVSDFFVKSDSVVYEIGSSTGSLTRMLAERHAGKAGARFIGLDVEPDMVAQAKRKCADLRSVELLQANAVEFEFQKADLIVAYYTVQFIAPKYRQQLFDKLYQALNWGGALMLFEKVRAPDARFQDIATQVYHEYKLDRGYTSDDVVGKMRSLKGVLEPFSTAGNLGLMERAGFVDVTSVMKYVCFEGFLAIK